MKKRFANSMNKGNNIYQQKRVDRNYFKGYIAKVKANKVENPFDVSIDGQTWCVINTNYIYYIAYPDNENYALTIIYDENENIVQWYFDVAKSLGIENNIPFEEDLYIDLVIRPNGEYFILDEDELLEARDNNLITDDDVKLAYKVVKDLESKYAKNLESLEKFTENIKLEFFNNDYTV